MYQQLRVAVVIPAFNEKRPISRAISVVPGFAGVVAPLTA